MSVATFHFKTRVTRMFKMTSYNQGEEYLCEDMIKGSQAVS